jgi:hypothetical protein
MSMSPSGSIHRFYKHPGRGLKVWNSASKIAPGIDVLGDGGMVIAPPSIKPGVGQYKWLNDLPVVDAPAWLIEAVTNRKSRDGTRPSSADDEAPRSEHEPGENHEADPDLIAAALAVIPNYDVSWNEWNAIAMATHRATKGSAFAAFDQWSRKSRKYDAKNTHARWNDLFNCPPTDLGAGTIFHLANKASGSWRRDYEGRSSFNGTSSSAAAATPTPLEEMNAKYCVIQEGGKAWVITFEIEYGRLVPIYMTFSAFQQLYMNRFVMVDCKSVPLGTWWLKQPGRKQYAALTFEPGNDAEVIDDRLNLWRGWGVAPKPGDWSLMREHIRLVLASDDQERFEYIMRWLAWLMQHPGRRAEVAIVFKGKKGTGKGTLGNCLMKLFGQHSTQVSNAKHLAGNFNAHLRSTCFLFGDECYWPGDKQSEGTIKRMITEPTRFIEGKGRDGITVPNYLHIMLSSNEDWVVPAGENERRFFMCAVSEVKLQDQVWFEAIIDQLQNGGYGAMLYDLIHFDLGDWHPRRVPKQHGLLEQQAHSLSPLDSWWVELLETGTLAGCDPNEPNRARSNKYDVTIKGGQNSLDRHVTRPGLYDQARASGPRLRSHTSDHALGAFLAAQGCKNDKKVLRLRTTLA